MGKSSLKNWQDVYYDGEIDERSQVFCEEEQRTCKRKHDDGWDKIISGKRQYSAYIEDVSDDYLIQLKNGQISRVR